MPRVKVADDETVDRHHVLIQMQAVFRIARNAAAPFDTDGVTVSGRQIKLAKRADRQVFKYAIDRDVHRMFGAALGIGDAAGKGTIDVEIFVAKIRIDLEEHALSLGLIAVARRIILTEPFRRQIGGDERFRDQREIEMNIHVM